MPRFVPDSFITRLRPRALAAACSVLFTAPVLGQLEQLQMLRAAQPQRVGEVALDGLGAAVTISRDRIGVPAVRTDGTELDAMRALGFLHGQERFFQMDGMRRQASGRLAALAGSDGVFMDREARTLGLEHVAREAARRVEGRHRAILEAYCAGVNAGVSALDDVPLEFGQMGFTREEIPAWTPEDTFLIFLFMFRFLNEDAGMEPWRGVLAEHASPEVVDYLLAPWDRHDTLIVGRDAGPPPIPGPGAIAARPIARPAADRPADGAPTFAVAFADAGEAASPDGAIVHRGSNAWLIAGDRTRHGGAIMANDPHLALTAPGIWYRADLAWDGGEAVGLTLPGSPGVIIGSNGHVAWGFTNTTADFQDLVVIEVDPDDPSRYRIPDGWEPFTTREETIEVRGGEDVVHTVRSTRWGPVVAEDGAGRPLSLQWTGLDPEAVDFGVLDLAIARELEAALDAAAGWGGPSQNAMIAAKDGRIGWTLTGRLPVRIGYDGRTPVSWADGGRSRRNVRDVEWRPRVVDPESGVIITANHRTVGGEVGARLGPIWANPGRAYRIGERLAAADPTSADEALQFDVQLDTVITRFLPFRDVAIAAYGADGAPAPPHDGVAAALEAMRAWDGRAELDEPLVAFMGTLRFNLISLALERLLEPVPADLRGRVRGSIRNDEAALRILEAQPDHLLPDGHDSWGDAIRSRLDASVFAHDLEKPWRDFNVVEVRHPLSRFVPSLAMVLDMPPEPQPGHWGSVRVTTRSFGASARIVVSPGREDEGICHVPAGQSGHPGVSDYRAGHADWVRGRAAPLRAGRSVARLRLVPGAAG